ncbi:hypothetical protein [Enhygromyxa salina]|uniref:hypothetical protein n=1 Tax=Enhygromyxa salina TaxID=215803 RepID=UPI00069911BC|nr:hypothetical protein [Enhygromyxa salina]
MLRHFIPSLALLVCACSTTTPTQPPPAKEHNGAASSADADPAAGDAGATAEPTRPSELALPSGPLCDTNADCSDGQVCEGAGCEPGQGRCVSAERACTRDLAEYCGCDGKTFSGSGSCPGARYAYRGACAPNKEDGEPCSDGRQCRSGQCVGEGLEGCTKADLGVCGVAPCTRDLATYCSCNNTLMQSSGSCPDRQFAYRGPCESN